MDDKNLEEIQKAKQKLKDLTQELKKEITGQDAVVRNILLCLVSQGHVLLEGMPGLAKTLLAKSIAKTIDLDFKRIQFTPDLLPADILGTVIFNPKSGSFEIRKGPVFTGVLLADEINRSPAKVQSALLQCMEEKMVTLGDQTFILDPPFLVIATENPIDQEGTFQLPEAQMDRFLMKINVDYPSAEEEVAILSQHGEVGQKKESLKKIISAKDIMNFSKLADSIYAEPKLKEYVVRLVRNSRPDTTFLPDLKPYLKYGASPRASLALLRLARASALLEGRNFILPNDIQLGIYEAMRHRIILSFEALSEDVKIDSIIKTIVESTELP